MKIAKKERKNIIEKYKPNCEEKISRITILIVSLSTNTYVSIESKRLTSKNN